MIRSYIQWSCRKCNPQLVIEAVNSIREQLSLRYINLPILRVFKIDLLIKVCVKGESNPSKVQLGVRFPLNAYFFRELYFENSKYRQIYFRQRKLLSDRIYCFNDQLRMAFPTRSLNVKPYHAEEKVSSSRKFKIYEITFKLPGLANVHTFNQELLTTSLV